MARRPAHITALVAAFALIVLIARTSLHYHYSRSSAQGRGAARIGGESAGSVRSVPVPIPDARMGEPYPSSADRSRAQAALQECLKKAQTAAQISWDGMCTSLAQRNSERREICRQQGGSAEQCRSLYPETPRQDCLLPHQTASSIAQAQQSAKSDCYQQFQAEMR